jgi:hypothetical protein
MRTARIYAPSERPDVEVLIDGRWCIGEVRAWIPRDDGTWRANVAYRTGPHLVHFATLPASHVRLVDGTPRALR